MQVLITGAMGWLGKALTEVVSREHTVRVFELEEPEAPRESLNFDGEIMFGSVTDFESVRAAVKGQDAVVHAAVSSTVLRNMYQPGDPVPFDVNVRGTYNILEAAHQEGVECVILIGAVETHVRHPLGTFVERNTPYTGDGSIYDLTKRLQESVARWFAQHHDLNIIILRLGDVLDLDLGLSKRGDENWRDSVSREGWLHRYDVGEACLRALELEHEGLEVFQLIGSPLAKKRFDIARTESILGIQFTTEFDRRSATERD